MIHWIEGVKFKTNTWHAVIEGSRYTICGADTKANTPESRRNWATYQSCWPACGTCLIGMKRRAFALLVATDNDHLLLDENEALDRVRAKANKLSVSTRQVG